MIFKSVQIDFFELIFRGFAIRQIDFWGLGPPPQYHCPGERWGAAWGVALEVRDAPREGGAVRTPGLGLPGPV